MNIDQIYCNNLDHIISKKGNFNALLANKIVQYLLVQGPDPDVLEGDDALGHVLRRVLEVVEATVVQHEPAPLPGFPTSTLKNAQISILENPQVGESINNE